VDFREELGLSDEWETEAIVTWLAITEGEYVSATALDRWLIVMRRIAPDVEAMCRISNYLAEI